MQFYCSPILLLWHKDALAAYGHINSRDAFPADWLPETHWYQTVRAEAPDAPHFAAKAHDYSDDNRDP